MKVYKNYSLKEHNGFKVDVSADFFIEIESEKDILELFKKDFYLKSKKKYILGDGYNTIFVGNYQGIIIKNNIKGIKKIDETEIETTFKVGAGENWHNFVEYTVNQNLSGIENIALVPGQVGSAPIQNIGAYGQVQEDTFLKLEAINLETGKIRTFSKKDCEFGYRTSFFKEKKEGKKYFIISVTYKFKKVGKIIPGKFYHSRYESIGDFLDFEKECTVRDIFKAVIKLRNKKLPKVEEWGTLGSIFMNPIISKDDFELIQKKFPDIQYYPADKMKYPDFKKGDKIPDLVKIPIGWVLEELGWKNKWIGGVGTYKTHALLVVTKKSVKSIEILDFIEKMKKNVLKKTGLILEPEIRIIE